MAEKRKTKEDAFTFPIKTKVPQRIRERFDAELQSMVKTEAELLRQIIVEWLDARPNSDRQPEKTRAGLVSAKLKKGKKRTAS